MVHGRTHRRDRVFARDYSRSRKQYERRRHESRIRWRTVIIAVAVGTSLGLAVRGSVRFGVSATDQIFVEIAGGSNLAVPLLRMRQRRMTGAEISHNFLFHAAKRRHKAKLVTGETVTIMGVRGAKAQRIRIVHANGRQRTIPKRDLRWVEGQHEKGLDSAQWKPPLQKP